MEMAVRHECWVETFKHDESKRVMSWTFEDQERTFDYVYGCDVSKDHLPVVPSTDDLVTLITVGVDFDSIDFLPSGMKIDWVIGSHRFKHSIPNQYNVSFDPDGIGRFVWR